MSFFRCVNVYIWWHKTQVTRMRMTSKQLRNSLFCLNFCFGYYCKDVKKFSCTCRDAFVQRCVTLVCKSGFVTVCWRQIAAKLRCPVSKFIVHTISHFFFLALLALATLGADEKFDDLLDQIQDDDEEKADEDIYTRSLVGVLQQLDMVRDGLLFVRVGPWFC